MTGAPPADPPVGFSLLLPATWTMVDLDPATSGPYVERMVRRAFGTADSLAQVRRAAVLAYREMLRDAVEAGAFFAANYADVVEDHPLSASLIAFLGFMPSGVDGEAVTLDSMARDLAQPPSSPGEGETLEQAPSIVELGVGTAVRTRTRTAAGEGSDGRQALIDVTRFFVPLPEWDRMLVMAFSTPILAASDAFAGLFDQMALSARWRS